MNAVIDIGTNTIRAVVYDEDMTELFNQGVVSKILDYTADGILTVAGVVWLSNVVGTLSVMAEQFAVKPKAFATSAFRELKNADDVADYIKEYTGIEIIILSGDDEAMCDYLSLKKYSDKGIGIDLGGGSCQIISFDGDSYCGKSHPVGVKRIKNKFVSSTLPSSEEFHSIYEYINETVKLDGKADTLYIFGGSARALAKLADKDEISVDDMDDIMSLAFRDDAQDYIAEKVNKRADTVLVGAVILRAIADMVGADVLKVVNCSVREGFVIKYCG